MIYVVKTEATEKYINMPIMIAEEIGEDISYEIPESGKIWHYYFLDRDSSIKPNRDVAYKWDNKIFQYEQFKDSMRIPDYDVYENSIRLVSDFSKLKRKYGKFMITLEHGFYGMEYLYCDDDITPKHVFQKYGYNKKLRVSKFIKDADSVSLHLIVANHDEFYISPITKQNIKETTLYRGGSYPYMSRDKFIEYCSIINNALVDDGYFGLSHIDFLVTDEVYFGEINPRIAGSTPYMCYSLEQEYGINLPYLEYHAVQNRSLPSINTKRKCNIVWDFEIKEGMRPNDLWISHKDIRNAFNTSGRYHIPFGEKYVRLKLRNDKGTDI